MRDLRRAWFVLAALIGLGNSFSFVQVESRLALSLCQELAWTTCHARLSVFPSPVWLRLRYFVIVPDQLFLILHRLRSRRESTETISAFLTLYNAACQKVVAFVPVSPSSEPSTYKEIKSLSATITAPASLLQKRAAMPTLTASA